MPRSITVNASLVLANNFIIYIVALFCVGVCVCVCVNVYVKVFEERSVLNR